uniref:NHL repeat-containing protein n=1 Tax=Physcomitrium patens TaxID=3218 RepID=A0A7I4F3G9_PHYPA
MAIFLFPTILRLLLLATSSVVSLALSVQPDAAAMINALEVDSIGYDVTTVLNGNLRGLSFYCIDEATDRAPAWAIVLDSTKSKVLRVQLPLSQDSVVEHIAGSLEGKAGYQDGRGGDALFNHPKMLTLDSDGNIYVADVRNTAIRMITTQGFVTTIAGGMNRTGHNDGEGRVVTFSNDFGVTYLRKNCTLLIVDRGNRMVRAMKLPHLVGRCHDSPSDVPGGFTNGKTLLVAVGILLYSGIILGASTGWLKKLQSKLPWILSDQGLSRPSRPLNLTTLKAKPPS